MMGPCTIGKKYPGPRKTYENTTSSFWLLINKSSCMSYLILGNNDLYISSTSLYENKNKVNVFLNSEAFLIKIHFQFTWDVKFILILGGSLAIPLLSCRSDYFVKELLNYWVNNMVFDIIIITQIYITDHNIFKQLLP